MLLTAAVLLASCATAVPPPVAVPQPAAPVVAAPAGPRTVQYDEALPVSIKTYYPDGTLSSSTVLTYDDQGRLLRKELSNGNGVLLEVRVGQARGDVWRITAANAQTGTVGSIEERQLGSAGELLVQTFLNGKGAVQASNEYTYDEWGRCTQWVAKSKSGDVQGRTRYLFDAKGNNTKTEFYDAAGSLTNVFECTFDAAGQILSKRGYDSAMRPVEVTNYTWNGQRKVKDETIQPLARTTEYVYGEKPAPTEIIVTVLGKVIERQKLEYRWFTKTKVVP